jgi:DNA polymerase-3 subunit gamma/tau
MGDHSPRPSQMTDDESPGLGLDLPEAPPPVPGAYRVLARKYRPQSFGELIGQDAMVTTLGNAIASGRIAHAFLLTGVRGVGKTSTARLVAKALNCIGPDGTGGPTIEPCGVCDPCRAITEGRFIDVLEIDAASHNGVDDVREMIESVRYSAVSARFKIYIIDEVHMMTKPAFNALLKTLEEPPAHVKFLMATTEVAKVPVTILSRCQRFDLKRISAESLTDLFAKVSAAEGVEVEPEALAVIARAAEGSARDGLSILDQAIAHGEGKVTAAEVRDMLGLADRGRVRRLFAVLLEGDAAVTLAQLDEAHALGLDPAALMRGLMETVHAVTRAKAGAPEDLLQSAEEREAAAQSAGKLGWAVLHRLWQLLLKGLQDVTVAPDPQEAATMALLRLVHAADLPDPAALMARLATGDGMSATAPAARASAPRQAPASRLPENFPALVEQLEDAGRMRLGIQLRDHVGLVSYAPGELVLRPLRPLGPDFARELSAEAKETTGTDWEIRFTDAGGEPSLHEQTRMAEERERAAVLEEPAMKALLAAFPDATLETLTTKGPAHARL